MTRLDRDARHSAQDVGDDGVSVDLFAEVNGVIEVQPQEQPLRSNQHLEDRGSALFCGGSNFELADFPIWFPDDLDCVDTAVSDNDINWRVRLDESERVDLVSNTEPRRVVVVVKTSTNGIPEDRIGNSK